MSDGRSAASVVAVDPERAAKERDAAARAMLRDVPVGESVHKMYVKKDLVHTVPYTLKVVTTPATYDKAQKDADEVLKSTFQLVHTTLDVFNPQSELSLVNQLPVGKKHQMSEPLARVMQCCQEVCSASRGAFDPAVGGVIKELREAARTGTPVPYERLQALSTKLALARSFALDFNHGTVSRLHEDAKLDLGAVNKGFGVDYVVERLMEMGYKDVFFEWGGDVRASGKNAAREPWAVGITRPPAISDIVVNGDSSAPASNDEQKTYIRVIPLSNESIATSGDYENVTRGPDGKLYASTYDSITKSLIHPSDTDMSQVSVQCVNCMYADALATAALLQRDPAHVRRLLGSWQYLKNTVTDYTTYTREGETVATMFKQATESKAMRANRIAGSLPARVVVIGGGLAGCCAAIEAANCGATVVLLEKEKKIGGNSAKATSGINGWGTPTQAQQGIVDGDKYFERDTFRSGLGGTTDAGLVKTLSVKSAAAIRFLINLGVPLSVLSQLGGASRKRCHRAPDQEDGTPVPIGFTIMRILENHIRTNLAGKVTIMTNVHVSKLMHRSFIRADGVEVRRVEGVEFKDDESDEMMRVRGDAVILATGGFSNDRSIRSLLQEYAPQLASFPTTNGTWATGDGVKMARELGVQLVDMDKVQLHPTGLVDPKDPSNRTKYLGPEALRGSGGILLNKRGERFINELELRSVVSQAIMAQDDVFPESGGSKFAHCVLNEKAASLFGVNSLGFYWKRLGLFKKVENVSELASLIGCPEPALKDTLVAYHETSSKGTHACTLTGKNVFPCVLGPQGPFYVAYVTPSIHYTMGGCLISPSAEIQTYDATTTPPCRRPILGLFGAGEVTGGVHGKNRLGGNSLLECVVFGRIAGDRAATILQKHRTALSMEEWRTVVLREYREGGEYGQGSRVLRFNLPGALQRTGLALGQFIGIRGEWDGQQLVGYYSPITLPDDYGVIGILARSDKGRLAEWLSALVPGDAVEMKACGGLVIDRRFAARHFYFKSFKLRKLALIAGGTGIAPMLQIVRAGLKKPFVDSLESMRLIYAAEDVQELTYRDVLLRYENDHGKDKFSSTFVLNKPPANWTGEVGFVDPALLRSAVQPAANDLLVVICGPPIMQRVVKGALAKQGYNMALVRTVDETDPPAKV